MTPYKGLARDNNLRPDITLDQLRSLKPVFDRDAGTLTAGNSTPLTDGASAVLLASEQWAAERGLPVLAYLTLSATAAVDFFDKKRRPADGARLRGAAHARARRTRAAGLRLLRDPRSVRGAGAVHAGRVGRRRILPHALGLDGPLGSIDRARLNVNGSSLATGHPFAATGGRIVGTLAKMLANAPARGDGKPLRGLISICAAGGQGVVAILER